MSWRFDPPVVAPAVLAAVLYGLAIARYTSLRKRCWPRARTTCFAVGVFSALFAIESPLDAAGDVRFAPHMWQHLILTDLTAPLLLLGAPLLLVLSAAPVSLGRGIVGALKSPLGRILTFPIFGWSVFILSLWIVHFSSFFEAALVDDRLHVLEHGIFLGAALLFWFPVIAIGPAPSARGPLAYPLRMLYLFLAMPAEGLLGFSIYGARELLYRRYAAGGIIDQQTAGEIMWIGSTLAMFLAFMIVGFEWSIYEQRLGERLNARRPDAFNRPSANPVCNGSSVALRTDESG